jgi:hypothetical protein
MVGDSRTRGRASLTARGVSAQAKGLELRFASEAHEIELRSPFLPKFGPQCRNQHYQASDPRPFPRFPPSKPVGQNARTMIFHTVRSSEFEKHGIPLLSMGRWRAKMGSSQRIFESRKLGLGLGVSLGGEG